MKPSHKDNKKTKEWGYNMSPDYTAMYSAKHIKKEDAISFLRPNDSVLSYGGAATLLTLLDDRLEELDNISLYTMFLLTKNYRFLYEANRDHVKHYATFVSKPVRAAMQSGHPQEIILTHFSDLENLVRCRMRPNVLLVQATPMDEDGYFTMGFNSLGYNAAIEIADRIIVHVNPRMPKVFGECNKLHVSKVSAIFEEEADLPTSVPEPHDEIALTAASFVAERIPNGATLQIGVGRVPDAVGTLLRGHKDLGVHTELFSQSMMDLTRLGVINNSKKTLLPGKAIFAFAGGARATQEIYDFIDNNPDLEMRSISWVNDPRVIAQHDNFISINSALMVDLTGQVGSETLGMKTFSGPGGQLDFVRGAKWSKGGRSFIVIDSHTTSKDGEKISKIDIALLPGSVVTTPRADVDAVVTEYGIAELRFKSLAERAKSLIAIAHPDFRDELTYKAKKAGYFA